MKKLKRVFWFIIMYGFMYGYRSPVQCIREGYRHWRGYKTGVRHV